jgi:hypothetical protein
MDREQSIKFLSDCIECGKLELISAKDKGYCDKDACDRAREKIREKWNEWALRIIADMIAAAGVKNNNAILQLKKEACVDFSGVLFIDIKQNCRYECCNSSNKCRLIHYQNHETCFQQAEVCYVGVILDAGFMSFSEFKFPGDVKFCDAIFCGETKFHKAVFEGDVNFKGAKFNLATNFDGASFCCGADFSGTKFNDLASFNQIIVKGDLNFTKAEFENTAFFMNSSCLGSNTTLFEKVHFRNGVYFDGSMVRGDAGYRNAQFGALSSFADSVFCGSTRFDEAEFKNAVIFRETQFWEETSFFAINCESAFVLSEASFDAFPPDFAQAHFREAPALDELRRKCPQGHKVDLKEVGACCGLHPFEPAPQRQWLGVIARRLCAWLPGVRAKNLMRYRHLKRLSIQNQDYDGELRHFSGELAHMAVTDRRYLFAKLYYLLTGYGRRAIIPFIGLIVQYILFTSYYLWMYRENKYSLPYTFTAWMEYLILDKMNGTGKLTIGVSCVSPAQIIKHNDPFWSSLRLSLSKSIFMVAQEPQEQLMADYKCLYKDEFMHWIYMVGAVQSFISAILIFLLFLVLRNHFRLK